MNTTGTRSIAEEQLVRMRAHLSGLQARSPWYKQVFQKAKVHPTDVRKWEDVLALPFTTKDDLSLHNEAFRSVPLNKVVDHVFTSGSTGIPVPFLLTENDLDRLARSGSQLTTWYRSPPPWTSASWPGWRIGWAYGA